MNKLSDFIRFIPFLFLSITAIAEGSSPAEGYFPADGSLPADGSTNLLTEQTSCKQYSVKQAVYWSCSHLERFTVKKISDIELAQIINALKKARKVKSLLGQGDLDFAADDYVKAEQAYRQALRLQPELNMTWIKLALFYSDLDRDADALQILHNALEQIADNANIYYEMGLIQVRLRDFSAAIDSLAKAAILAPENAHYSYVYAIAMNSNQRSDKALDILRKANKIHPENEKILTALITINQDNAHNIEALKYAEKLLEFDQSNSSIQALIMQLKSDIESD